MKPWLLVITVTLFGVNGQKAQAHAYANAGHSADSAHKFGLQRIEAIFFEQQEASQGEKNSHPDKSSSYFSRLLSPENLPNIGLLVAAICGFWVAIRTLNHMRESSERQLRAYVLPESAGMWDGTTLDPPQPERANIPFVAMIFKNSGQTPAYKVCIWAQISVIPVQEEHRLGTPAIPEQFSRPLGAGGISNKALWFDRSLGQLEIADIGAGTRAVYLHGRIEYLDVFGKRRYTNFRLHYTGAFPPPKDHMFLFSGSGNDAT